MLVVLLLIALVGYLVYRRMSIPSVIKGLPTPPMNPLLGHLLLVRDPTKVLPIVLDFCRHGFPRVAAMWFGPLSCQVMVYHPETVRDVLRSNTAPKNFFYDFLRPWLGDGLLISRGEKWRDRRHALTPAFHFEALKNNNVLFNRHAQVLANKWGSKDGVRNIFRDVTLCTLDTICETAMGVNLNSQLGESIDYVEAVAVASEGIFSRFVNPLLWKDWVFNLTPTGRKTNEAVRVLKSFTRGVIERRHEELAGAAGSDGVESKDFLGLLLTHRAPGDQYLTDDDVQEEVDTFVFEGHDTTAVAVAFFLALIAENPSEQALLHAEVDRVLGDRPSPTLEDLNDLPLLKNAVKEAMRLFPSVPMHGRVVEPGPPITVEGKAMPVGTEINIIPYILHRNPDVWDRPDDFVPSRWAQGGPDYKVMDPFAYTPFSAGPRNCIGQKSAQMTVHCIAATLLKALSFHKGPVATKDMILRPEVILKPQAGVIELDIRKRKK